jgi:DNA-directed RNA polymerase I subunit RPA1
MHVLLDYNAKCSLSGIAFQYFNSEEIHKLSVKEITVPQALDRLLNPIQNGLYDLTLGPLDKNDVCLTCNLDYFQCPGHFGHINLVLPVYNPIFFKELVKLLRATCLSCHHLLTSRLEKEYFQAQMTLLSYGLVESLSLVEDLYSKIINNNDPKLIHKITFRSEFNDLIDFILKNENRDAIMTSTEQNSSSSTRNVLKSKIDVLKDFMEHKLKFSKQTCPNCNLPLRQLRAEHNSKLFYAKGVSARILKKNKTTKLNVRFNLNDDSENEKTPTNVDEFADELNKLDIELENDEDTTKKKNDDEDEEEKLDNLTGQSYLTPIETRKHLEQLLKNERETLLLLLGKSEDLRNHVEMFFFDSIAVPPSKYRPISQFKEQRFENSQTTQLSKLLQQNIVLKDILNEIIKIGNEKSEEVIGGEVDMIDPTSPIIDESVQELLMKASKIAKKAPSLQEKLQNAWLQMQGIVNVIYDSDMDKLNADAPAGLKQLLEKKQGLFRMHMMGKRVNYAGRSVISPDVYIGTDEIGIDICWVYYFFTFFSNLHDTLTN